jgi:cell division protein FtsZ
METNSQEKPAPVGPRTASLKIIGVGSAGLNILEQVAALGGSHMTRVAVNTDGASLLASTATEKVCLESKMMRGLGTGGDPERGRASAEQHRSALQGVCTGADIVFLVAGLGGGAGTGIMPLLAQIARDAGALVLAFVTLPFDCEGNRRQRQAAQGLQELRAVADGVICLPNQKLFALIDENTSVLDTFKRSNELVAEGVTNVARLIAARGLIEIHFDDLCQFLRGRHGESAFATAEACGPTRSREVMDRLLSHPMLDGGRRLSDVEGALVSIVAGPDLTMAEINRVMEQIHRQCERAQVIMGAATDPRFGDRMCVTLVATCREEEPVSRMPQAETALPESAREEQGFDTQFHRAKSPRPGSRFVPPPPALTPEKMEQLAGRQAIGRSRKASAKMRQGQLPLEIISKGRFDKSEPTIHKGEDLDVPTYIRRGVALN